MFSHHFPHFARVSSSWEIQENDYSIDKKDNADAEKDNKVAFKTCPSHQSGTLNVIGEGKVREPHMQTVKSESCDNNSYDKKPRPKFCMSDELKSDNQDDGGVNCERN